ncbi:MAG: PIG-L family deacetylase [Actinobacteria bacterium]|nr:PIG-L family deacetylase [Actinomycetota bacterium]
MFFNEGRKPIKVATVSAHPDDETFGVGGTIARHIAQGDRVYACITTKGYSPDWPEESLTAKRKQAEKALESLGITDVEFLDYPTVKLNTVPGKDLNDSISTFIDRVDPQVVYSPFPGDLNSDHGIVARAAAIAVRPVAGTRKSLLYFETPSSTEWGRIFLKSCFQPDVYVDISKTMSRKLLAASCYELEKKEFPHPRSLEGIKTLARLRGMEVGLEAAEAFSLALHVS